MRTLVIACNILLLVAVCLVLATDGAPREAIYVAFTVVLMVVPLFTAFVLLRGPAGGAGTGRAVMGRSTTLGWVAALGNIVLLGLVCLAVVDQYPHPEDPGFIEFVALTVLTPILSAVVLLRNLGGTAREAH